MRRWLPDGDDEDMWVALAITVAGFTVFMLGVLLDWGPICHRACG
jgi:hypothetical protein